ncbi:MAG: TetR/AcrR family transcriptional regulator [Verrucomicrobiae bacterium]|nr:TetR/AcrR family transcriptional regulator [Verrucomicrobiae bacterium]
MKSLNHPYHHGHLRQALLRAAEAALETHGVRQLSLRELSRELGVSHASPQRHFATKQDLINALAIMGFERLDSVMARAAAKTGSQDFNTRLTNAALAHLGFALKHPALLALMFEAKRQPEMPPELLTAMYAAFSHIPRILKAGQAAGKIVAGDPYGLALTFGAVIHGLVAMSIEGKIKGRPLKAIVPETVQHMLDGLGANKSHS